MQSLHTRHTYQSYEFKKLFSTALPLTLLSAPLLCCHAFAHSEEKILPTVTVQASDASAPANIRYQLPQSTEHLSAQQINEQINVVDSEDSIKYLPSIFLRKRNYGDTQAVMATRTWGVNSSARSLVYADDVLLSALIANNNTLGAPRWGMVAPEEIERVDVLYGPFAAAYPGNSMGAVVQITTRMPEKFEASLSQTEAVQNFSQYGTQGNFGTHQSSATLGNRHDDLAWWFSVNRQNSDSQPLGYITNGATSNPAGTSGTYPASNKLGAPANVVGAGGLLRTQMDAVKFKLAYAFSPSLRASYTLGLWRNDAQSNVQSYLSNIATGQTTYGGVASFANNKYNWQQAHSMHSLALKSKSLNGDNSWDWEAIASIYNIDTDRQKTPAGVIGSSFTTNGKAARLDGSGWATLDLKAIRHAGAHDFSMGLHQDRYILDNPTYNTSDWNAGTGITGTASIGRGKTETSALWGQDAWRFASGLKATLGARFESWKAFDGYNYNSTGSTSIAQPTVRATNISPKASLAWAASPLWLITASLGQAYRYPTVSELYQLVSTGPTHTSPNANLRPERVLSSELAFEHESSDGRLRASLFEERVAEALIAQNSFLAGVNVSYVMNVAQVRSRGVELSFQKNDIGLRGLEVSGSLTYVNAKILADSNWASANGSEAVGKRTPYVPDWRATLVATYRPNDKLATTLAMRYSGKMYSTMDNTDSTANVYGAFDSFVVFDARVRYAFDKQWSSALGIDNLNNRQYFLFHPFPQRTLVASLQYRY